MVAYIDEFKDRFRVGPICRVLAASLDCGSVTPRGYRMFKSRPVSRMAARHEALACISSSRCFVLGVVTFSWTP
ncbi:hypothetical protein MCC00198_17770 [Bifidobacterium longum subsp. longum]|nr:hypothetical protein MCC00198_17770 [Bifidobacterium longum subsp. longum]